MKSSKEFSSILTEKGKNIIIPFIDPYRHNSNRFRKLLKFDATHIYLRKGKLLLIGIRYPTLGLYYIDFDSPTSPPHVLNPTELTLYPLAPTSEARAYSAHHMTTKTDLVQHLHQKTGSTVTSTWIKAIEHGYYASWPGITTELVRKYLPKSIHTAKGHLCQ